MAPSSALLVVAGAMVLAALAGPCSAGVNITSLPHSLIVKAAINGMPVTGNTSVLVAMHDNLTVHWTLNGTFQGQDSTYKKVVIRLCYGAASTQGRKWRASNTDLALSKACRATIAAQPYHAGNVTLNHTGLLPHPRPKAGPAPQNQTTWQAPLDTPGAHYFIRVFALNSSDPAATPADSAVAMGQTTDTNMTNSTFYVEPYTGTTPSLTITIVVLSVVSYALLFGFFTLERLVKKNK